MHPISYPYTVYRDAVFITRDVLRLQYYRPSSVKETPALRNQWLNCTLHQPHSSRAFMGKMQSVSARTCGDVQSVCLHVHLCVRSSGPRRVPIATARRFGGAYSKVSLRARCRCSRSIRARPFVGTEIWRRTTCS